VISILRHATQLAINLSLSVHGFKLLGCLQPVLKILSQKKKTLIFNGILHPQSISATLQLTPPEVNCLSKK
jgi:hypothetical protein